MKKASAKKNNNYLRPEYDLSKLKGGVRGKYYRQAIAGTNLVLVEELTKCFQIPAQSIERLKRLVESQKRLTERIASKRQNNVLDKTVISDDWLRAKYVAVTPPREDVLKYLETRVAKLEP